MPAFSFKDLQLFAEHATNDDNLSDDGQRSWLTSNGSIADWELVGFCLQLA